MSNATNWVRSGRGQACPVCGRNKDADCRWTPDQSVVLCHTHTTGYDAPGYRYAGYSDKGAGWGKYYRPFEKQNRPKSLTTYYDYPSVDGSPLVRVVRRDTPEGKKFYQEHWNGSRFVSGVGPRRDEIPIYRYADVRRAIEQGSPIYWVEGEGVAESLWALGLPATTTIGGSKGYRKYGKAYRDNLKGAKIIVCPDQDQEGMSYAQEILKDFPGSGMCRAFPLSPQWSDLPANQGADLADWIQQGATRSDIEAAVVWPEQKGSKTPKGDPDELPSHDDLISSITELEKRYGLNTSRFDYGLHALSKQIKIPKSALEAIYYKAISESVAREIVPITDLAARHSENQVREWFIERLLPRGTTVLFYADGGAGKTLFCYDLIKSLFVRESFLERRVIYRPKTLLIQTDEPEVDMMQRMRDKEMDGYADLHVTTEWTFGEAFRLRSLIESQGYELVVIDSFASANRMALTEEKDAMHAAVLFQLRDMANSTGCSFIVLHHTNKKGTARGNTSIRNNVSECWHLRRYDPESDAFKMQSNERVFQVEKSRAGVIQKLLVSLNEDLDFEYVDDLQKRIDGADNEPATWAERVLAYFQNNPAAEETPTSLGERWALQGIKPDTAKKILLRLAAKGSLESCGRVTNSRGEPSTLYRLSRTRTKQCPGIPVSPETIDTTGIATGTNYRDTTGTDILCPGNEATGTAQNAVPVSPSIVPVAETQVYQGSPAIPGYRDTHTLTREGGEKLRRVGAINQYSGPPVGSRVIFNPVNVNPKAIQRWKSKGMDLPWGQTGTVVEIMGKGSRYVAIVALDNGGRVIVDDLNALQVGE